MYAIRNLLRYRRWKYSFLQICTMKFFKRHWIKHCAKLLNKGSGKRFLNLRSFTIFFLLLTFVLLLMDSYKSEYNIPLQYEEDVDISDTIHTKFILVWTPFEGDLFDYYYYKDKVKYMKNHCSVSNCVVTDNRNYFGDKIEKFNAIIFNGKSYSNARDANLLDMPKRRTPNQIYIFYETRSAYEYPICIDHFVFFFNWTMTYKLDSDIPVPFFVIKDKTGLTIGPKLKTEWRNDDTIYNRHFNLTGGGNKPGPVIWFENFCTVVSEIKKIDLVNGLKKSLLNMNLDLDIVGKCNPINCKDLNCKMLKEGFYRFYLPLESLDNPDYVNADLLQYMKLNLVPIVMGGINFSNFMPKHSYIDGNNITVDHLTTLISNSLVNFKSHFRWRKHYIYEKTKLEDTLCSLCAAVNDEKKMNTTKVYEDIREWWSSVYKTRCRDLFDLRI